MYVCTYLGLACGLVHSAHISTCRIGQGLVWSLGCGSVL